jgi:hypothetical protein
VLASALVIRMLPDPPVWPNMQNFDSVVCDVCQDPGGLITWPSALVVTVAFICVV